jgi:uncharacterized protein
MALKDIIPRHAHEKPILLQDVAILPGEKAFVKLNAGILPSGSSLSMAAHVFRSKIPGPTVLLLGGIHGDEINGIQIITSLLEAKTFDQLQKGSVIAIPLLNVYGFNNMMRDVPDGKDINRSFPGSTGGSQASRLARVISKAILPYVDIAIDLHTGSGERYNHPQVRYSKGNESSIELANLFNAPFAIGNQAQNGTFRKTATDQNVAAIVYEGGESVRINKLAIDFGINGIIKVLQAIELIQYPLPLTLRPTVHINHDDWARASKPGIFIWLKKSGDAIKQGELIGIIKDPYATNTFEVLAKADGYIIGHNNAAVVNQGDPLFHIGTV